MTDVEDLLTRDGAAWRAAQPAPLAAVDPADRHRRTGRHWQPLAAAAAVVLLAGGGAGAVALTGGPAGPVAGSGADAIVRDGDRVTGEGLLIAVPGRPVRLCVAGGVSVINSPAVPDCRAGVTVTGVDVGRIPHRQPLPDGVVYGSVRVTGVYRHGSVAVTRQEPPPQPDPGPDPGLADPVPCPAPAGGWPRGGFPSAATDRLNALARQHPALYAQPTVHYPDAAIGPDPNAAPVVVVLTTGDVTAAARELARVFPAEHLCVAAGTWSIASKRAAIQALSKPQARAVGIAAPEAQVLDDTVHADVAILDTAAARFLAGVPGGPIVADLMLTKTG